MEYSICTDILKHTYIEVEREEKEEKTFQSPSYLFTNEREYTTMLFHNLINHNTYRYDREKDSILSEFILLPRQITKEYRHPSDMFYNHSVYLLWNLCYSRFNSVEGQYSIHHSIKEYIKERTYYEVLSQHTRGVICDIGLNKWCNEDILSRLKNKECVYKLLIKEPRKNVSWFHPIIKRKFHNVVVFRFEISLI